MAACLDHRVSHTVNILHLISQVVHISIPRILEDWIQHQCETKDRLVIWDPVKEKSTLPKRVRVKWHIATNFQVR